MAGGRGARDVGAIEPQFGKRQPGVVDGGAARRGELTDAVHRVVVVGGEQQAAAVRERIRLAHELERGAGVLGEHRHVVARGVEPAQHVASACPRPPLVARRRRRAGRMRVAEDVRRQPLGVFAHLRGGVQAGAGVIEIGVSAVRRGARTRRRGGRRARPWTRSPETRPGSARTRPSHTIPESDCRVVVAAGLTPPPDDPPQPQVVRASRAAR